MAGRRLQVLGVVGALACGVPLVASGATPGAGAATVTAPAVRLLNAVQITDTVPPPPTPPTAPPPTTSPPRKGCDPSYPTVCIPPRPPDLDCPDIPYTDFAVVGDDPHGFDRDNDGIGCET